MRASRTVTVGDGVTVLSSKTSVTAGPAMAVEAVVTGMVPGKP